MPVVMGLLGQISASVQSSSFNRVEMIGEKQPAVSIVTFWKILPKIFLGVRGRGVRPTLALPW